MRNETVDMKNNAPFFLGLSLGYGVCFAIAFYKNFIGIIYLYDEINPADQAGSTSLFSYFTPTQARLP